MIISPDLYKKVTGRDFNEDFHFCYPTRSFQPVRLMKEETGLPVNILNVVYSTSLEFGVWRYIEFQGNTDDNICEEKSVALSFDDNANLFPVCDAFYTNETPLLEKDFNAIRDYVRKAYADPNSHLNKLMKQREAEWNAAVKTEHDKWLEQKNNVNRKI